MSITVGDKAPEFTLPDQDGKKVSLKDFKGKWLVLYFYPKDDTPGCTLEGIEFTAQQPAFKKTGAVVVGVSGDSAESHCEFIKKHSLGITLLTDADKGMMTAYGAFKQRLLYGKSFLGIVRSTVLVDPKGVVAHYWPTVNVQGHAAEILEKLKELHR
jgi:peroxiredoxin Q/BCP